MNAAAERNLMAAMDYLAEYTGTDPVFVVLDQKLQDGGSLTDAEVKKVLAVARWRNMDKGN